MQDKVCLFCLEEVKEQEKIRNLIRCDCELLCHADCMQKWFETKHQLECPVCHAVSLPNLMFQRDRDTPQVIHIIHIDPYRARDRDAEVERRRFREKCAACCCGSFLLVAIIVNVLSYF